ncbi:MAG: hypothetical protein P8L85_09625 [Rubripirellula sp.]|nr:hypothetical protein [Rubripirellula sp.]
MKSITLDNDRGEVGTTHFMNRQSRQAGVKRMPLPGRYAIVLGPVVGAAVGLPAFLQGNASFAGWMIGLFAAIGMIAGCSLCFYDWWCGRTTPQDD